MSLLLNTPPAAEPLTLAEAKAHLRVNHTDDDAFISTLMTSARHQIESRTGLCLINQGWSVFADAWPANGTIAVPLEPLQSVDEIRIHSDDNLFAVLDPAHYYVDKAEAPPRVALRHDRERPQASRIVAGIEVRVTAGYGLGPTDVPQDLKQALLLTVGAWFSNRGEEAVTKPPMMADALIAPYRRMRLS
jgi:uncharacterized phiE125 gp8 family phage protein